MGLSHEILAPGRSRPCAARVRERCVWGSCCEPTGPRRAAEGSQPPLLVRSESRAQLMHLVRHEHKLSLDGPRQYLGRVSDVTLARDGSLRPCHGRGC